MRKKNRVSTLETLRDRISRWVERSGLGSAHVTVTARPLSPEEAIGRPTRRDYPILIGKERVIEARVLEVKGQAFTDAPSDFRGSVRQVLDTPLDSSRNRAVFTAVLNALCRHFGVAGGTVHCKDEDPEKCGKEIAAFLRKKWGGRKVAMIGFNPAIAENLVRAFGPQNVRLSDLDPDRVGTVRFGVKVEHGGNANARLVAWADVTLITGTTLVNDTFDRLWKLVRKHRKKALIFGMTAAGVSAMTGIRRICPYGRDQ